MPTQTSDANSIPDWINRALVSPAAYASDEIYAAYRWLRENTPVGRATPEGFDPFWVVTRYDDVQFVSRNNDWFHNGDRSPLLVNKAADEYTRMLTGGSPHLIESLVQLDGEVHRQLRLLTQAWFAPKNLKSLEVKISALAAAAAESLASLGGRCEFVRAVALPYPLRVVMEVLGVPPEDEELMMRATQEVFTPADPDLFSSSAALEDPAFFAKSMQAAVAELEAYFRSVTEQRRRQPRDDIATVIANAKINGLPLSPAQELGYYSIIATAGHDTTSSSIAAAMLALAQDPILFARVKSDRSLLPALVEEAIRFQTPVKTFMRTATLDVEVGGQAIAKGDWLMLCYASANRDATIFDEPDTFRLDRKTKGIAFGGGAHVCLGQHLARMEIRLLLEKLLDRLRFVALDGEPTQTHSFFVNGPKSIPIRFELEPTEA